MEFKTPVPSQSSDLEALESIANNNISRREVLQSRFATSGATGSHKAEI